MKVKVPRIDDDTVFESITDVDGAEHTGPFRLVRTVGSLGYAARLCFVNEAGAVIPWRRVAKTQVWVPA